MTKSVLGSPGSDSVRLIISFGLLIVLAVFAGCSGPEPAAREEATVEEPPPGESLYLTHCAVCHGDRGEGNGPASNQLSYDPKNLRSDTVARWSREELVRRITEGNPSRGMPAWRTTLSRKERRQIAAWIQEHLSGASDG